MDIWVCLKIPVSECTVVSPTQEMTAEEKSKITDLKKCNFGELSEYFKAQSEARKSKTKEDKLVSCYICPDRRCT